MTAVNIADDILKLAKRRGIVLTPMQLMKLTYISYGWHLAFTGERLFADRVEAWKYGPVIPNLYRATKRFGRDPIPSKLIGGTALSRPDLEEFLDSVVENYGSYSGIALSNLTHRSGTPWSNHFIPNVMGIEIPDDAIRTHYLTRLNEQQSTTAAE